MKTFATTVETAAARFGGVVTAPIRRFYMAMTALAISFMTIAPTFCPDPTYDVNKLTMDGIFSGMVNVITKIALYVGGLLAVGGLFSLVMAYKDDNADGQSRAVRLIVIGLVLIGFDILLGTIF